MFDGWVLTDQVAFFPGQTKTCFKQMGVFDLDDVVFRTLWEAPGLSVR